MATTAAAQKRLKAKAAAAISLEDLAPSDRMAREIINERPDLRPSVERIMHAGLTDDQQMHAISLFQTALSAVGDECRDPRVAITRGIALAR
jgi:hypothetical protein